MKVVFHSNELKKINQINNNIRNLKTKGVDEIVLVINAEAIQAVENKDKEILEGLLSDGVRIELCEKSIEKFKIKKSKLNAAYTFVDSAVYSIVEYQTNGYAYIKA